MHDGSGYVVLGLIAFRVLWGFIGTRRARFADFVHRPGMVRAYARDFVTVRARRYLGHNPLGGVMILALLSSIAITGITGWQLEQAENAGHAAAAGSPALTALRPIAPAHADDDDDPEHGDDEALEEIHEFFANLTVLLVILHVTGVLAGSLLHRENLVRAMFTGRKSV